MPTAGDDAARSGGSDHDQPGEHGSPEWWSDLPFDRPAYLVGASLSELERTLDPLPRSAPAVVVLRQAAVTLEGSLVASWLDEIDMVIRQLYPVWLDGAEQIEGRSRTDLKAILQLCRRQRAFGHYGPFLYDMAVRSLRDRPYRGRLADEVRAEGLARLLATSYGRPRAALLLGWADGPAPTRVAESAHWWSVNARGLGIWLAGPSSHSTRPHVLKLPPDEAPSRETEDDLEYLDQTPVVYPALQGRPHPGSPTEQRLERALLHLEWADGRRWNYNLQVSPLINPYRVDLVWLAERCVLEVDGDDHRIKGKFRRDHRRSFRLAQHGFTVLRITNDDIYDHLDNTLRRIEQFLRSQRGG